MSFEASDTFEGTEGDSGEPAPAKGGARSNVQVLRSLKGQPFEQAVKLLKYLKANSAKREQLVKTCDPETLTMIAQNHPGVL